MYGKVYTFHSFLALVSTCNSSKASNLTTTLVSMLPVIILSFVVRRHSWGVFCTCEDEIDFHMYGKVYTFHSFLELVSTCNTSEASNLTTTFVSMLPIIILSFVIRRHGWGVFSTCEDEIFTCTAKCTHFIAFWPSFPHATSLRLQTWPQPLFPCYQS